MPLDTRWKNPQGKTPEQLHDAIVQIIRELRKSDYLAGLTNDQLDLSSPLVLPAVGGTEGGEVRLGVPLSGTSLVDFVSIDIAGNLFRVFEGGGSARGFHVDLTQCAAGVGTDLFIGRFESAQQTITSAGALTIAHGLGAKPQLVAVVLQNTTADNGYAVGDEIVFGTSQGGNAVNRGVSIVPDATNLVVRYGSDTNVFEYPNKTTGVRTVLVNDRWALVLRAWRFQ